MSQDGRLCSISAYRSGALEAIRACLVCVAQAMALSVLAGIVTTREKRSPSPGRRLRPGYLTTRLAHLPGLLSVVLFLLAGVGLSARADGLPEVQTVFVIVLENTAWSAIKGNTNAPYINETLLPRAAYCEQYENVPGLHPSLPNYLWLEAGTNFGIGDDNEPAINHQDTTNHLVTLLEGAGVSWKTYQEDISGDCVPLIGVNGYAPKHNPFVYFDDVTGTNDPTNPYGIAHIRPYTELEADLTNNTCARYNFITPNICDDMHDSCGPLHNPIQQGDSWLASEAPKILASAAYSNKGALFITWDESYDADTHLGMILLSPLGRGCGYASPVPGTHSSMLRTLQELFHAGPFLGDAANAADLSDLFRPTNSVADFRICHVANLGGNAVRLTVTGAATNAPLVLECSSNLAGWSAISTNAAPEATCSMCVSNAPGNSGPFYYRFAQQQP